jgi:glycosyltransferase involved in cell wall biosynthesis
MVFPLVKRMLSDGTADYVHWVSLNPSAPETIQAGKITFHSISLEKEKLKSYGNVKETIWGAAHGTNPDTPAAKNIFWSEDFSEYTYYNRLSAELIGKLDREHDFDIFYIHDFQQLPIGQMLSTLKPKIFRWHIPFDESMIPDQWKELLATYFNSYDMVIVSSSRYLASLKSFGYSGRVRKVYPYVDPSEFSRPSEEEVSTISTRLGIDEKDDVVLIVARMDPMKGQDRAIRALATIASRYPRIKLVLVGNGSFSGSGQGLGLPKSEKWRMELEALSKRLRVRGRIIFAGHLVQRELDAMYERSKFTILPSIKEGFGLVVVESWLHRKACLVTEMAGVSELIKEGKNGLLVNPEATATFAQKMRLLLDDDEMARLVGLGGYRTSKRCTIDAGVKAEMKVINELVGE